MSSQDTPRERVVGDVGDMGAYRELREYARGGLDVEHHDVHPIAGLIPDDEVRDVLISMADVYDPRYYDDHDDVEGSLPPSFWETPFARRAIERFGTEAAQEAIENGDLQTVSYIAGLPSYESDVSGLHAINQLVDWLVHSEQCKLVYMAALMGRGKTDLAVTFLQLIHDHFRRISRSVEDADVPTPEFAANFEVTTPDGEGVDVREINEWPELQEWAEQGSSDEERWFIFDEASTELTAQSGANAQDVAETMAPFVKKMRKCGVNMIVIGHDKGDIHVAIRSMADFVDKTGLKTASFYAGINKREPQGHMFDVAGIPQTSWGFDTDDMADWSWGDEREEDPIEIVEGMTDDEFKDELAERGARLWKQTELSQRKVAQALSNDEISVSASSISRRGKRLQHVDGSTGTGANA